MMTQFFSKTYLIQNYLKNSLLRKYTYDFINLVYLEESINLNIRIDVYITLLDSNATEYRIIHDFVMGALDEQILIKLISRVLMENPKKLLGIKINTITFKCCIA